MKAIVFTKYGLPDVLELKEVEKPTPKDNEILIKVHASSINDWDWGLLRGTPFVNRMLFGLLKPKVRILGCDIAGQVEAVGRNVKKFQPGDEVFGDLCECGFGCFAEYVCAPENALTLKPAGMTFEEAAAMPQAAVLALQGLRNKVQVQPGQKVLINGAGGGAGTFTVQIAKLFGAEVTGVDSTGKLDMMRSIGADHVIDYTQEDFTKNGQRYDLIIDHAAYHSFFDYKRALSPGGTYIIVGGSMSLVFKILIMGSLISMFGTKKMRILGHKPNKDLVFMIELFKAGKVKPVIDKRYTLSEVPEAFRYFGEGLTKGKVVITV
ncbi:MAG: NAD(P)-dependent alcohol dehydrogenase [Bacteroidales bacterium]|nr:NAD(P)-dependent alcohol dehydrogenase [Bacteroidales bacterium]